MTFTVGSTVRVPCRPNESRNNIFTRIAIVSTINEDDDNSGQKMASVILEDPTPQPPITNHTYYNSTTTPKHNNGPFLITPNFLTNNTQQQNETTTTATTTTTLQTQHTTDEEYDNIPLSSIQPLLPFELQRPTTSLTRPTSVSERRSTAETHKQHGDALLRLRDPSAAVPYYENALSLLSKVDLGGSIVVKRNGRLVLAEVDCIEDDENDGGGGGGGDDGDGSPPPCRSLDVTYVADGAEGTIFERDVLLGVWEGLPLRGDDAVDDGGSDRIQEKILLNLARCCLYLAEIDTQHGRSFTRSSRYRRSAILASSLAIVCADFLDDDEGNGAVLLSSSSRGGSCSGRMAARLLRARAYVGVGKEGHAKADLQSVLREDEDCVDAKKLMSSLERAREVKQKTDRKLAKDMCTWIDAATKLNVKIKK